MSKGERERETDRHRQTDRLVGWLVRVAGAATATDWLVRVAGAVTRDIFVAML